MTGVMLTATLGIENCIAVDEPIDHELELVRSVAQGDRAAFERLFRLYHSRIYKFSIRMLRDHALAEEVAGDTLYAVWNSAASFREQSAVSSWILGIAYRRSLKSYKQNARHTDNREPVEHLQSVPEPSPAANPETQVDNAMEIDNLNQGLSTLSSNHRAVMELMALGYSVKEISVIVECPENTVKTRVFHARRQLRNALQDPSR